MTAATNMAIGAMILPPALLVSFQFKLATGKPQNLEEASQEWAKAAQELEKASHELQARVKNIPADSWTMNDRALYEKTVHDFCRELDALHDYCMAVSYALIGLAWALFAYAVFAIGMAVYLDALAIAAAFVVDYPACVAAAQTGLTVTWVATGILANLGLVAGAAMGGGAVVTAKYQGAQGNTGADAALKQALINGSAGAAANLVQSGANGALAFVNRSNGEIFNPSQNPLPGGQRDPRVATGSKGSPLSEIDLDADRGFDGTWDVGGGAKIGLGNGETELATHHKIQEGEYKGGNAEIKGKYSQGPVAVSGGPKLEWDDKGVGGSGTVGAENPQTGSKVDYEHGMSTEGEHSDKVTSSSPSGSKQWNPNPKNEDPPPPWDIYK
ncbi:hypothetical protein ETD83_19825 [Actinomadura soli]|uniref:Uncharacterized protein n=2 Tax=Actinomadura soli TaxID=2508997 RepID=A0A5C4JAL5_9ACTN|nr:hypothetical protein ETD83_19825 [Actinomadura soli]